MHEAVGVGGTACTSISLRSVHFDFTFEFTSISLRDKPITHAPEADRPIPEADKPILEPVPEADEPTPHAPEADKPIPEAEAQLRNPIDQKSNSERQRRRKRKRTRKKTKLKTETNKNTSIVKENETGHEHENEVRKGKQCVGSSFASSSIAPSHGLEGSQALHLEACWCG